MLLALGMGAFLSNASADLPKPGEYKGTLTITKTMSDREFGDAGPAIVIKTVFKASARVDAAGFLRVVYSGDREPIFGRFQDRPDPDSDLLHLAGSYLDAVLGARTIEFSTSTIGPLAGPEDQVTLTTEIRTKLRRVGK